MNTILVTGASGFVAEHLIPILRQAGNRVIGVDRKEQPSAACDEYIQSELSRLAFNDIRDHAAVPDVIIHLAAARADWGVSDAEFYEDNVEATAALLNQFEGRPLKRFIFVSSIYTFFKRVFKFPLFQHLFCYTG